MQRYTRGSTPKTCANVPRGPVGCAISLNNNGLRRSERLITKLRGFPRSLGQSPSRRRESRNRGPRRPSRRASRAARTQPIRRAPSCRCASRRGWRLPTSTSELRRGVPRRAEVFQSKARALPPQVSRARRCALRPPCRSRCTRRAGSSSRSAIRPRARS